MKYYILVLFILDVGGCWSSLLPEFDTHISGRHRLPLSDPWCGPRPETGQAARLRSCLWFPLSRGSSACISSPGYRNIPVIAVFPFVHTHILETIKVQRKSLRKKMPWGLDSIFLLFKLVSVIMLLTLNSSSRTLWGSGRAFWGVKCFFLTHVYFSCYAAMCYATAVVISVENYSYELVADRSSFFSIFLLLLLKAWHNIKSKNKLLKQHFSSQQLGKFIDINTFLNVGLNERHSCFFQAFLMEYSCFFVSSNPTTCRPLFHPFLLASGWSSHSTARH